MSSEVTITVEQANAMRQQCQEQIELAKALARLEQNPDFKKVFLEEYTKTEPARLTSLLAEPSFNMSGKKAEYREDIKERLIGIARFNEYIRNLYRLADQAEKSLQDLNNAESTVVEA